MLSVKDFGRMAFHNHNIHNQPGKQQVKPEAIQPTQAACRLNKYGEASSAESNSSENIMN
jgi:hypothetical protein